VSHPKTIGVNRGGDVGGWLGLFLVLKTMPHSKKRHKKEKKRKELCEGDKEKGKNSGTKGAEDKVKTKKTKPTACSRAVKGGQCLWAKKSQ